MESKLLRYFSLLLLTITAAGGADTIDRVYVYASSGQDAYSYNEQQKCNSNILSLTGEKISKCNGEDNSYKMQVINNVGKTTIQINMNQEINKDDLAVVDSQNIVKGSVEGVSPSIITIDLKKGENIIRVINKTNDQEMYKFYITYKDINIDGLKSDLQSGDLCTLKASADGRTLKIKWTSKSSLITLTEDGILTACGNGTAGVDGVIYDDSGIEGTVHFDLYIGSKVECGWIQNGEDWTYRDKETGKLKTGWFKDKDDWYYFNEDGRLRHGWVEYEGNRYYLTDVGNMAVGWFKDNGTWYYAEDDGKLKTGWFKDHGNWYYFNEDGSMQTSDKVINGSKYKFNKNGELYLS